MAIAVNEVAPDFELPSSELSDGRPGKKIKLSSFRGKPVVLAFYPLDFSPVCTNENTCFRNDLDQFNKLGAQVLGISVDSAWCHKAFADSLKLTYPLLADFQPRGAVAKTFGLFLEDKGITKRATVLIDKQGKVAWLKEHDGARSDDELLTELRKLA
ncbi:MAG TPA: redoxin domain-containing protein [Polyangiales bacterium]